MPSEDIKNTLKESYNRRNLKTLKELDAEWTRFALKNEEIAKIAWRAVEVPESGDEAEYLQDLLDTVDRLLCADKILKDK